MISRIPFSTHNTPIHPAESTLFTRGDCNPSNPVSLISERVSGTSLVHRILCAYLGIGFLGVSIAPWSVGSMAVVTPRLKLDICGLFVQYLTTRQYPRYSRSRSGGLICKDVSTNCRLSLNASSHCRAPLIDSV